MGNPQVLRPSDRQLLAVLRQHGELCRSQLALLSGLPRSTITDSVTRLMRSGSVVERPVHAAREKLTGRPPKLLALRAPSGLVGVLSLTHGSLQAGILGPDGTVHAHRAIDAHVRDLAEEFVESCIALLDQALDETSFSRDALMCAVIGLPLPVVPRRSPGGLPRGQAYPDRPHLQMWPKSSWDHSDPSIDLSQRLGIPAWLENDANLGALGEADHGAAMGMTSFIYVKMVQGVGAGLVLDGRLHHGVNGLAGELAHIHVQDDGSVCRCGGRGCLVTILNSVRLVDLIQDVHPAASTMADVLSLAAEGDTGVWRLLRDLGRTIGRSLADFCVYVAPEAIIIDGLLENASEPVIDGIKEMMNLTAPPAIASQVQVLVGKLGNTAELHGGAALARRNRFGQDTTAMDFTPF
jgi:predicted NBD/HSP70 family sugar kinase